jgi:ABC-2 type transport system ATP-binding protein
MSENAIEATSLSRMFCGKRVVDNLNLEVPKGSIFGFLGANGAGKTTTIRMLMGHLHPTDGAVRTLGADPWDHDEEMKRRVAYVSENMALPGWMTPGSACRFCASLYPAWDCTLEKTLLKEFELLEVGAFRTLSKGQKRKLCILLALCQGAELLVMDEPASGLDTLARRAFLDRILDVACSEGRTVFFSSHILSDVERVVDRVAILVRSRAALSGELDALKNSARKLHLPAQVSKEALACRFQVLRYVSSGGEAEAMVLGYDEEKFRALCAEHGCGGAARQFGLNLEDIFVEVTRESEGE